MKYTTILIREMFLNFFKKKKHIIIPGSSLVPPKNSNLLFTNAGMNQFQDVFLGKIQYPFSQVATVQNCLRTGGKHNDFHQIGYSGYHNTFFEMLGNFSFGAYSKKEAISFAWELLTDKNWFNIPEEKLFVTVYYQDYESYNIWKEIIKLSQNNIIKIYDKNNQKYESDNFWQMGDTGPCGPCTEIFFKKNNNKDDLYELKDTTQCIEIWNIVFIQFNKINNNKIIPLNKISIDTGMGLERIASVLQNVTSNYQTDVFKKIKNFISNTNNIINPNDQSLNIITDHIRASIFIIDDNIIPSNEGRGYILRKIIRRALYHGNKIGIKNSFLFKLVDIIIEIQTKQNKDMKHSKEYIIQILQEEEQRFYKTLNNGLKFLNKNIKKAKNNYINHKIVFYLHDTLGFPINLTKEICQDNDIYINEKKLNDFIIEYKKNQKNKKKVMNNIIYTNQQSHFLGYEKNEISTIVKKIFINNQEKKKISKNEYGVIILDKTPFFGESGGQVGDHGTISHNQSIFHVQDTQNFINTIGHIGKLSLGEIKINDTVTAKIDQKKRKCIQRNHTTTHLLHAGLKKILQYPIEQKGSFINEKYLRFDFSYPDKINNNQIYQIENFINNKIQDNITVSNHDITLQKAQNDGYIYLKEKKYPSTVRTVSISDISKEICKGTHVQHTGEIGIVQIISCKSIAFNTKRIEIITGMEALNKIQKKNKNIKKIQDILQTDYMSLFLKIKKTMSYCKEIEQENKQLHQIVIQYQKNKLIKKIKKIKNINFIMHHVQIKKTKSLKILINQLKKEINSGVIILFYQNYEKHIFVIGVTKNLINKIQATQIIRLINQYTKTIGGGKPELAQCTSTDSINITQIIINIQNWIICRV